LVICICFVVGAGFTSCRISNFGIFFILQSEILSLHPIAKESHAFLRPVVAQGNGQGLFGSDEHNQLLCTGYPGIYEISLKQDIVLSHYRQDHSPIF